MNQFSQPPAADTLGRRIVQARSYALLKQRQVEDALGISRRTLSSWEHDKTSPSVQQLIALARVTGFPATWFVDGLGAEQPEDAVTLRNPLGVTERQLSFEQSEAVNQMTDEEFDVWFHHSPAVEARPHEVSGQAEVNFERSEPRAVGT
jgi:transcriptional regulator with XRE-family HTH domain